MNTGSKRTLAPSKSIFYRKIPIGRTQQKEKVPGMAAVDSTCTKKVPFRRMTVDTQYPNPKHVKVPGAVNSTRSHTTPLDPSAPPGRRNRKRMGHACLPSHHHHQPHHQPHPQHQPQPQHHPQPQCLPQPKANKSATTRCFKKGRSEK